MDHSDGLGMGDRGYRPDEVMTGTVIEIQRHREESS